MAEEALLGALEGGTRGGLRLRVKRASLAGDVRRPHGRVEVVVDDRERPGISVVDGDLFGRELVFDQFVFDTLVGERTRGIKAERLEVTRQHLHRRDAALLDRLDKLGARGEREVLAAPETEALGISEIVHPGSAGRRDIDHASIRQGMLEPEPCASLLRGRLVTTLALASNGVLHRMRLVENDHSVKTCPGLRARAGAQPFDYLTDARKLFSALIGVQRSVGRKKDTLRQPDWRALPG